MSAPNILADLQDDDAAAAAASHVINAFLPAELEERTVRDRVLLQARDPDHRIDWKVHFNLGNSSRQINQCRNSIQGKVLLTDELGFVCQREDLLVNGCCNVNNPSTSQYLCKSCSSNGCCGVYEYCVSCCLQPDKVIYLFPPQQ
ncbi:UPF0454 protein C12orf49-like [Acipenser ruthenus]|uniref:SREBP regulating gene protein n=1 Tax=Acipenser ruthenus TaxID=7906 RepID=A0A444URD9_ACIRT|nr:UPF0454 protein C12orf49-like [Acipenser ruthenus]